MVLGVILALVIVALAFGLVPLKEVSYAVAIDYQDTETYYETEPYEDIEKYTVAEPYEATETYFVSEPYEENETYYEDILLEHQVTNSYDDKGSYQERRRIVLGGVVVQDKIVTVYYPIVHIVIKNTDDIAGKYSVSSTLHAVRKDIYLTFDDDMQVNYDSFLFGALSNSYDKNTTTTIQPDESVEITFDFKEVDISDEYYKWEYEIEPGTKPVEKERLVTKYKQVEKERLVTKYKQVEKERPVTKYREVEKERTVTKYRQVEKDRTITKQRPETRYKRVTLLDYLLHY